MQSPLWLLLVPFFVALSPLFCPPRLVPHVSGLALLAEIGLCLFLVSDMSRDEEGFGPGGGFAIALYFSLVIAVYLFSVSIRIIDELVTRAIRRIKEKRSKKNGQ